MPAEPVGMETLASAACDWFEAPVSPKQLRCSFNADRSSRRATPLAPAYHCVSCPGFLACWIKQSKINGSGREVWEFEVW